MAPSSATTHSPSPATAIDQVIMSTDFHVTSAADICMVLANGTRIFANAGVLRHRSPVFRVMLGPQFYEGQAIINNPGCPSEIVFPEDDPEIMLTLVRLLHCRDEDIDLPSQLEHKNMLGMFILADKYDVCPVVKSFYLSLIHAEKKQAQSLWYLLCAAYTVGYRELFTEISARLLRDVNDSCLSLIGDSNCRETDLRIAVLLETKRDTVRRRLFTGLVEYIRENDCDTAYQRLYSSIAEDIQIAPSNSLLETVISIDDAMHWYGDHNDPTFKDFEEILNEMNTTLGEGICFDCVGSFGTHEQHSAKKPKPGDGEMEEAKNED